MTRSVVRCLVGLLVLLALPPHEIAAAWRCVGVGDGDTLVLENDSGARVEVSLAGLDAPELDQPAGAEARSWLEALAVGREVRLEPEAAPAATVTIAGRDVSEALVEAGFGWLAWDGETRDSYAVALFVARGDRRGLWAATEPVHPARWRQTHTPTPTPRPATTLADLGASVKLAHDSAGSVVVDRIPSRFARDAETEVFVHRMVSIAEANQALVEMQRQLDTQCPGGGAAGSDSSAGASVWSPQLGRWVDAAATNDSGSCAELRRKVSEGHVVVDDALEQAANEARRGGVKEADIREVAATLGVQLP